MENHNKLEKKAQEVIKDLIALDPSLQDSEKDLNNLVISLLKNKPETEIDPEFEKALKLKVLKKVEKLKIEEKKKALPFSNVVFFKKLSFSFAAIAVAVIIILPLTKNLSQVFKKDKASNIELAMLSDNAFGKIENLKSSLNHINEASLLASRGLEELGDFKNTRQIGIATETQKDSASKSLNPSFSYEGENIGEVLKGAESLYVYQKSNTDDSNYRILNSIISSKDDLIKLNSDTKDSFILKSFKIEGNKDFPYNLHFDETSLNLYANWDYWPEKNQDFVYQDLLTNDEVIKIAQDFLVKHNIDTSGYGNPRVKEDFHEKYRNSENKEDLYIPEETEVVFPFLINNMELKDASGEDYGLVVVVSSNFKKVVSLSNLRSNTYKASRYNLITDTNRLIELAKETAIDNYQNNEQGFSQSELKLNTPQVILSKQRHYNEQEQKSYEIFVPALSFPVVADSDNSEDVNNDINNTENNIIVPLLEDMHQ